eukprot:scaffold12439_cov106-Skeletonema_marinoi.AAC.1
MCAEKVHIEKVERFESILRATMPSCPKKHPKTNVWVPEMALVFIIGSRAPRGGAQLCPKLFHVHESHASSDDLASSIIVVLFHEIERVIDDIVYSQHNIFYSLRYQCLLYYS